LYRRVRYVRTARCECALRNESRDGVEEAVPVLDDSQFGLEEIAARLSAAGGR